MTKKKKDTITTYNKDLDVVKEISIREFRDMIGGTGCGSWMKYAEDNKNKGTVNKLFEEYNKNKHDLEEAYEDHIIKSLNGKQEHIDVMSKTAFYVHLDDKKLMIETYPHILDKLLQIFGEERVANGFDYVIEGQGGPIINMSDMFLCEANLDEYITKGYSAEEAYDTYREALRKYQEVEKAI